MNYSNISNNIDPVFGLRCAIPNQCDPDYGVFISHIGSSKSPTTIRLKTVKQKEQICVYNEIGGRSKNTRSGSVLKSQPATASKVHQTHKSNRVRGLLTPTQVLEGDCRMKVWRQAAHCARCKLDF